MQYQEGSDRVLLQRTFRQDDRILVIEKDLTPSEFQQQEYDVIHAFEVVAQDHGDAENGPRIHEGLGDIKFSTSELHGFSSHHQALKNIFNKNGSKEEFDLIWKAVTVDGVKYDEFMSK